MINLKKLLTLEWHGEGMVCTETILGQKQLAV